MKSSGSIGFEQRAGGRAVLGGPAAISILQLNQLAVALEYQLAMEDAPAVSNAHWFSILPQLTADCGDERSQLLGGVIQNLDCYLVAMACRLIDQSAERS